MLVSRKKWERTILHYTWWWCNWRWSKESCRENTLPRSEESSHVRNWIRGNTKIGPSPGMWKSVIIKDATVWRSWSNPNFVTEQFSWVRILNGISKYVTETSEEVPVTSAENRATRKPVAKAKPRPKPTLTLSPVSIPYRERKWMDVEPGKIQSRLFWSVKIYDQIVTTWWNSSSRRWWSCKIWRPGKIVTVNKCGHFVLVNWSLEAASWQKKDGPKKVSVLLEP